MLEKITDINEKQKYDHELTSTQKKFIESVDEFLELKPEGSPLSFVNIACVKDFNVARDIVLSSQISQALAADDDQLAMESDGSYYPVLDVKKSNATFAGMSIRAWGWNDEKVRYTRDDDDKASGYIIYDGEKDQTRQLDISFHYQQGSGYIVETVSLYGSTMHQSNPRLYSQIWMSAYAETGYEGHGGKSVNDPSDELVMEFIDIAERLSGATTDS
jgi:hypothetical protein